MSRAVFVLSVAAAILNAGDSPQVGASGWQIHPRADSLLDSLHLPNKSIFHFDFEKDAKGGIRYVWLASAGGLYRYDGYEYKHYGTRDGLPSDFVRCVLVSANGELWVGTDKGAGVFTGARYETRGSEKGLAGPYVRRIVQDREGTIWFASDSWPDRKATGGLASLRGTTWKAWNHKDGLPSHYVVDEFTDSSGRHFAMTLDGPARLQGDRWVAEPFDPLPGIQWSSASMVEAPRLGVVLSNGNSVWVLPEGGGAWRPLGSPPRHRHGIAVTRDGKILIPGDTKPVTKAFFEWTGSTWKQVSSDFPDPEGWGIYLREAPDGSIWYAGVDCLTRWPRLAAEWSFHPIPNSRHFLDARNRPWSLGSDHKLAEFDGDRWQPRGHFTGYAVHKDGSTWVVDRGTVTRWNAGKAMTFLEPATGLRELLAIDIDDAGLVWVVGNDASGKAAASFLASSIDDPNVWRRRSMPQLGKLAKVVQSPAPGGGIWYLSQAAGDDSPYQLTSVANDKIEAIPVPQEYFAHFANEMLAIPGGGVLVYGPTGLHRWKPGGPWETIPSLPARMVASAVVQDTATWLTLSGSLGGKGGLLRLAKDGSFRFFPAEMTTPLTRGADGSILAGGRGKFYLIAGAEPITIYLPDENQQVVSINRDSNGVFWLGSPQGLARFRPDGAPPRNRIIPANDKILSGQPYIATAEAHSRFGAEWAHGHFEYSWSVDGGPWSPFRQTFTQRIEPASLAVGKHTIAVRSRDNGMDQDPVPAKSTFEVRPAPIQDQPWFGPGLLAATVLMGFSTASAITARRKLALKSAQSLDISERRYRQIVETAQEGIAVFDSVGVCTMANREFARIVALPANDVIGRHAASMLDGYVLEIVTRNFAAGGSGAGSYEVPLETREGLRRLAMAGRTLPTSEGVPPSTLVTFTDITAYRSAEDAIRRSEQNYRLLFETSPNPRLIVNRQTLRIVSVNDAACALYGYAKPDFLRLSALELHLPEDIAATREIFSKPLETGPLQRRHRNRTGDVFQVEVYAHDHDFDGQPCRMVLIIDKTDQDRAADQLRNSQRALAAAQRIAKIGSYEVRIAGPNGQKFERIWSDEMFHLTGLARTEIPVEKRLGAGVLHPEDEAIVNEHMQRLLDEGTPFELEHRIVRADGEVRHTRTMAHRVMQGGQKTVIGTIQDITEYRMLQAQSQHAQRLDSIGRLAGGVAHDFNNLLTVINGYSKLVLKRIEPGGRFHDEIQQIAEAGEEAAELTKRLLAFGRKQVLKPAVLDLNEVVRGAVPLLSRVCGEDVHLVTNLRPTPVLIRADLVQVNQLLLNLTTNARDAMPRGGAFTIETSELILDKAFVATRPGSTTGPHCKMSLSDTGMGIDQASLSRIFEPFFTTKERAGGTGLGLATVYGIVKQSGGYISVSSELGVGTRFEIFLPALASGEAPAATAVAVPSVDSSLLPKRVEVEGHHRTVLLVEDQPDVRQFIAGILVENGYRVLQAPNGAKALELYDAHSAELDLLVSDVVMPGMTGPELARLIERRGRSANGLRVLFISGYAQGKLDASLQDIKSLPILEKPFSPEALLERVQSMLSEESRPT